MAGHMRMHISLAGSHRPPFPLPVREHPSRGTARQMYAFRKQTLSVVVDVLTEAFTSASLTAVSWARMWPKPPSPWPMIALWRYINPATGKALRQSPPRLQRDHIHLIEACANEFMTLSRH